MAKVIDFNVNKGSCLKFAQDAFNKENYLVAVQNITEGLSMCNEGHDELRLKLYELLSSIYDETENYEAKKQCFVKQYQPKCKDTFCLSVNNEIIVQEMSDDMFYAELNECNEIIREIEMRDYTIAFGKIMSNNLTEREWQNIILAIKNAYKCDIKFKIDQYFVPIVTLLAKLIDKSGLVWLMLKGKGALHDLSIDGTDVFIENLDDIYLLQRLAESYYDCGEFESAKTIYDNLFEYNPFDGVTLFHLSACNFALGKIEEGDKYFAKYKSMFVAIDVPIAMYEEFFYSKYKTDVCKYPFLPYSFVDDISQTLIKDEEIRQIDYLDITNSLNLFKKINAFLAIAGDKKACDFINKLGKIKDEIGKGYALILRSALMYIPISDYIKKYIFVKLSKSDNSGNFFLVLNDKIVETCLVKLATISGDEEKDKNIVKNKKYQNIYNMIMTNIPFIDGYVPLKLNELKNVIVKIESEVPDFGINEYYDKTRLILKQYILKAKLNISFDQIEKWLYNCKEVAEYFYFE
ncbi:MAG: hypothetical protein WCR54_02690 [Clostridia bacterium]